VRLRLTHKFSIALVIIKHTAYFDYKHSLFALS